MKKVMKCFYCGEPLSLLCGQWKLKTHGCCGEKVAHLGCYMNLMNNVMLTGIWNNSSDKDVPQTTRDIVSLLKVRYHSLSKLKRRLKMLTSIVSKYEKIQKGLSQKQS